MSATTWWAGLARWEKGLAAVGAAGVAAVLIGAGVQGHQAEEPASSPCPHTAVWNYGDPPLDCDPSPYQQIEVHYGVTDWAAWIQYHCDDLGGDLVHRQGEQICQHIDIAALWGGDG